MPPIYPFSSSYRCWIKKQEKLNGCKPSEWFFLISLFVLFCFVFQSLHHDTTHGHCIQQINLISILCGSCLWGYTELKSLLYNLIIFTICCFTWCQIGFINTKSHSIFITVAHTSSTPLACECAGGTGTHMFHTRTNE